MGYTTNFKGRFELNKPLAYEHRAYLEAFSSTRRMSRDAEKTSLMPDAIRERAGLPIGIEGGYFVGSPDDFGQRHTPDILDYNQPPKGQPELWCQWVPTDDNHGIEWNRTEKFYEYIPWIKYLIHHFLAPWGYFLNGKVYWEGESRGDVGVIFIVDNVVSEKDSKDSGITIHTALDNALTFLESLGYKGGDIHDDLELAIDRIRQRYPKLANEIL